jgi:hypothetical protein
MADDEDVVNLNDMENDSDFVDVDDDDDNEPDSDMDDHVDDDDEAGQGHDEMEDDDDEDDDDEEEEDDDDDNNINIHDQRNGGMLIEGGVGEPHLDKDTARRVSSQADIVRSVKRVVSECLFYSHFLN